MKTDGGRGSRCALFVLFALAGCGGDSGDRGGITVVLAIVEDDEYGLQVSGCREGNEPPINVAQDRFINGSGAPGT